MVFRGVPWYYVPKTEIFKRRVRSVFCQASRGRAVPSHGLVLGQPDGWMDRWMDSIDTGCINKI